MKTVKVRIAVAVDLQGHWNAAGWCTAKPPKETDVLNLAIDGVGQGEKVYWLTAELTLPAQEEVAATVENVST